VLIYVRAEGVVFFHNFFCVPRIKPRVICLKCCGGCGAGNWTDFKGRGGLLAQLAKKHHKLPEMLIADGEHEWDYRRRLKEYPRWIDEPVLYGRD